TYMRDYYREKDSLSNWGILQTTAILACLYYYEDELNLPEIQSFAEEELLLQIKLQILDDGSQYEQSIMYHVEVLKSLMELVILAPKYYLPLEETIEKMVTYLIAMTGPDYCQLAIGDSDVTDTRDILTLATLVLKSSKTKSFSFDNVNLETLLLFGKPSIYLFEEIPRATIGESAYLFPDSGHVCLRDDRRYIFFKNGPFGSAHTHSDNNSVCLYDKKKPIFIDAGRYTYKEEQLRYDFKRSTSHSTCTLDGQPLEMIKDSWTYNSYPKCDYCQLTSKDRYHLVEGQLHVQRASDIYYHKRWLLTLPQAITLVIDKVNCPGEHVLTNQYILDDQVIYENGFVNDLKLVSPTTFNLEDCLISKWYNQLTESHK
ncbi:alginate lyase family protein, partial [Streptococcus agalactiae]|nr:alginate lyase family protein [Streptococcus agalactiae]